VSEVKDGAKGMWCDTFDADLLAVVPGAAEALGPAASIRLSTYSRLTGGKINCPSVWNAGAGLVAFFWTAPEYRPDAGYVTSTPVAECTFLEAVRDEWVHSCAISVNGRIVWRPPVRLMERLMYDLRGWTVLADGDREEIRFRVRGSLEHAARRLAKAIAPAGLDTSRKEAAGADSVSSEVTAPAPSAGAGDCTCPNDYPSRGPDPDCPMHGRPF